jgi:hypothetical protein
LPARYRSVSHTLRALITLHSDELRLTLSIPRQLFANVCSLLLGFGNPLVGLSTGVRPLRQAPQSRKKTLFFIGSMTRCGISEVIQRLFPLTALLLCHGAALRISGHREQDSQEAFDAQRQSINSSIGFEKSGDGLAPIVIGIALLPSVYVTENPPYCIAD